jgi:hypothetical protein
VKKYGCDNIKVDFKLVVCEYVECIIPGQVKSLLSDPMNTVINYSCVIPPNYSSHQVSNHYATLRSPKYVSFVICCVVSTSLSLIGRKALFSLKLRLSYPHEAEWTPFQDHHFSEYLVAPGIEPGTSARNSDHSITEAVTELL